MLATQTSNQKTAFETIPDVFTVLQLSERAPRPK